MSSGGRTKVAEYDPSVYEAEMQNKRSELTDAITKRAFGAAKEANVYSEVALKSLDEGLGLLSNYLSDVVESERTGLELSESARNRGASLRTKAQAGASFLSGAMQEYMSQADKADRSFKQSNNTTRY